MTEIDTILLDVDGTLVDSNAAHAMAWVQAFEDAGISVSFERVRPLIGMGADHLLPAISPDLSPEVDPGKRIAACRGEIFKSRYLATLRVMPGSRELLVALGARLVRRVLATSANADEVQAMLAIAGIGDLIDVMATQSDAPRSKPSPDILIAALRKAGSTASNSVMLGDTKYDVIAAHAIGVPVIPLLCGGSSPEDLAGSEAILDTPADLARALQTNSLREIVSRGRGDG